MQTRQKTFRIFGIPVWSITETVAEPFDKEAVYAELSERFAKEMQAALLRMRGA